jgi:hypothetical protein
VRDEPGNDESGLGRRSVMTLKGDGVQTRVVCGYIPCYNRKPKSSTSYQQHRRYFITKKSNITCPRTKFREDLVTQLKNWREDGNGLIVCLDTNKHIYKKSIGRTLTDIEGLAMREALELSQINRWAQRSFEDQNRSMECVQHQTSPCAMRPSCQQAMA